MSAPPKFIKDSAGVRKLNPAFKQWKQQQDAAAAAGGSAAAGGGAASRSVAPEMINAATALPVITSAADAQQNLQGTAVSESVRASEEMMQDEDIAQSIGVAPGQAMEHLQRIFAKYEVPCGLLNKLMMLSDYQFMEMIVDDSGSMNMNTDSKLPDGRWMTRWQEVHQRLTQMFEILAYVPCPPCYIRFLNRSDVIECVHADGEPPEVFLQRVLTALGQAFQRPARGTTPFRERIAESLARCPGQSMLRYFFGDGQPNGGAAAAQAITQMLIRRPNPQQNPVTLLSCTDNDSAVEWMKECEEVAPYAAECDDFYDEAREVLGDQGQAFPYTFGMHLICQLVGAACPDDLDALDESVPFAKATLDNLMGYTTQPQEYKHYFDQFLAAQTAKPVETALDRLKKDYIPYWQREFQGFLTIPQARQLRCVQAYHQAIAAAKARGQ